MKSALRIIDSINSITISQGICLLIYEITLTSFAKYAILSPVETILYFQATGKVSARQKLEGVYAGARAYG